MRKTVLAPAAIVGLLSSCASEVYTIQNTAHLTSDELIALCADLEIRANQDCRWNMRDRQSDVSDQLTWELGCQTRRDYARESIDNICHPTHIQRVGLDEEENQ